MLLVWLGWHGVSVADPESESCKLSLESNQSYGYIPSISTTEGPRLRSKQPCGSPEKPWIISVPSGQRINVTLMDFTSSSVPYDGQATTGTMSPVTTVAQTTSAAPCDLYAVIEEEKPTKRTDICGSGVVELSHAFASAGDLIKVTVLYRTEENARFLLRYEGWLNWIKGLNPGELPQILFQSASDAPTRSHKSISWIIKSSCRPL